MIVAYVTALECLGMACHIALMNGDLLTPDFKPLSSKEGGEWLVIVTWPDGVQQQISGFRSEFEAEDWIRKDAFTWLQQHPKSRHD